MSAKTLGDDDEQALLNENGETKKEDPRRQKMLLISFLLLVVIGLGNKIFQKLQTIPMYNYPYFLNLLTTFIYIPLSFAYILPMIKWGSAITKEERNIPWYKFAIMGSLDGIAGLMQSFAVNYIPSGSLIILLTQSAIPISMIISKIILRIKYGIHNYVGAGIVVAGLSVVLIPSFLGHHKQEGPHVSPEMIGIWCGVLIASCIPMTLSSVYKEKALGEVEIDVVYMNGWVAVYQMLITIVFAVPAAYASNLTAKELPKNLEDGFKCYIGINSVMHATSELHKDDCHWAPLFVTLYLGFNVLYNILIIMILKYGSSNILWLAMTIMVPAGNVAFALHFVPEHQPLTIWNNVGLVLIMLGLITYRFWTLFYNFVQSKRKYRKLATINGDGPQ